MQHAQVVQPGGIGQYLIPIAVFVVIFAFRARRMSRPRPLSLGQLWIVPAIYLVVVAAAFLATPPTAAGWGLALIGLIIGGGLGWWRGKTVAIHVDPASGKLVQRMSPVGILVLLGLVLLKSAVRAGGPAGAYDVASVTDLFLGLAVGTFTVMRLEMFIRSRRLLRAHVAGVFS